VIYNYATPIFCDINEETLQIDPKEIRGKRTRRTKAVIIMHYAGRPCDIDRIKEVADGLYVIEDAAHACGALYKGRRCGSLADIGCFSFHAVKNLSTADGGMLTFNNEEWLPRAKCLRWLGIDKGTWDRTKLDKSYWWRYYVNEIGLKCHMNDITAAIGLAQLAKLERMNQRRKEIARIYTDGLKDIDWIELPPQDDEIFRSSWHIYCIKCKQIDRNKLSEHLQLHGINTGVHYTPIHTYSCYGNRPVLPVAERVSKDILSLPMYPDLNDADVEKIIRCIREFKPTKADSISKDYEYKQLLQR
jgi:perosamine synthetase